MIYLAPLQSYTSVFYRKAFADVVGEVNKYFTPFFECGKTHFTDPGILPELDVRLNSNGLLIPQVATNDSDFLVPFYHFVNEMGYREINLNMGCPFPMLVKRKRGGGLLGEPLLLQEMLDNVFRQLPDMRLSLKIRIGVEEANEWRSIVGVINNYPITEVIVHPRIVAQKYSGVPDWDVFEEIIAVCRHPLVGNGDINSVEDYKSLTSRFPSIKAWMLGRGILRNPTLVSELRNVNVTDKMRIEKIRLLHAVFFNEVMSYYNDWNRVFNFLMTFWYYISMSFDGGVRHYRKLKKHNRETLYFEWIEGLLDMPWIG